MQRGVELSSRQFGVGPDLMVFPETMLLGWDNPLAWNRSHASRIPGNDTNKLSALAVKYNTSLVVGMAEYVDADGTARPKLFDSAVLIDSNGAILHVHQGGAWQVLNR